MNRSRWGRPLVAVLKAVIAVIVIVAVGRHVLRTWDDIQRRGLTLTASPWWLLASGLLYLAGLACCGRFYERVLRASPTPIGLGPALRAYLISHLGKYVPGKAMVVILRAGLSAASGARSSTAALATFYETLVMMASGSLVAGVGFLMGQRSTALSARLPIVGTVRLEVFTLASLLSLGLGMAFLVVVAPPVFQRISQLVSMPFPAMSADAIPQITAGLLARGLAWTALAWVLLGASQLAAAQGLGASWFDFHPATPAVVTASVALATVAGFVVAILPGGLGVREGVLMYAMAPALGDDMAVVAALALRLIWVAAELLAAAVLLPFGPRDRRSLSSPLVAGDLHS